MLQHLYKPKSFTLHQLHFIVKAVLNCIQNDLGSTSHLCRQPAVLYNWSFVCPDGYTASYKFVDKLSGTMPV